MCDICKSKEETKYLDLYVQGSEGLRLCHVCIMDLTEYAWHRIKTEQRRYAVERRKIREEMMHKDN